jgi:hypothetical protein
MSGNVFDEMRAAVNNAAETLRAADDCAGSMAALLKGRLRHVANVDTLRKLKRELRDFDMVKGEWKS